MRALAGDGYRVFVEVSPHAVLTAAVTETAGDAGAAVTVTGTLDREDAGAARLLAALARVHVRGVTVDWAAVLGGGHRVDLPTYAFQRQRYWPEPAGTGDGAPAAGGDGPGTAGEARFWAAIEGGDLQTLADTLAVEDRERLGEVLPALASWRRRERDRSVTGDWWYRVAWVPVTEPGTAVLSGAWLVVTPARELRPGMTSWCARALAARGARVVVVEVTGEPDRRVLAAAISEVCGSSGVSGVVSLLALDETPLPAHPVVPAGLAGTIALVQGLGDAEIQAPLWVLTQGAVAVRDGEPVASPVQAMAWGLGRVARPGAPGPVGRPDRYPAGADERARMSGPRMSGPRMSGPARGCARCWPGAARTRSRSATRACWAAV